LLKYLEKRKVYLVYLPLIIYWIALLTGTSFPTTALPKVGIGDKFMHFGAYFGLGVLLNLSLIFQNKFPKMKVQNNLYTIGIGSLYGIFDEVHQSFIPGRSMEFMDFVADFFGLVLAVVFVLFLLKLNKFVPQ
jgi:VanZ family protein